MGSPLDPVLACRYMEYFESEFKDTLGVQQPSFWARCIDDIILQWCYTKVEFNIFLNKLNQLESLIKLSLEWETTDPDNDAQGKMPFLDLYIHRSSEGFSFSIYRKPTSTNLYTHYYSAHTLNTKIGVVSSLFLRALRLCCKQFLKDEINHIFSVFINLAYPKRIIQKALANAKSRFYNPQPKEYVKRKYHIKLPSNKSLHTLRPMLTKLDVSTSFSTRNTIKSKISRTGPVAPKDLEAAGTYKIECKVCPDGVYYGETGTSLSQRVSGHSNDIRNKRRSNAMYVHMESTGHSFDLHNPVLLYKSKDKAKRQLVESSLIMSNVNCNLRPGDFPVCKITAEKVLHSLSIDPATSVSSLFSESSTTTSTNIPSSSVSRPARPNQVIASGGQPSPRPSPPTFTPKFPEPVSVLPSPPPRSPDPIPPPHSGLLHHSSQLLAPAPSALSTPPLSQRTRSKLKSRTLPHSIYVAMPPYTKPHPRPASKSPVPASVLPSPPPKPPVPIPPPQASLLHHSSQLLAPAPSVLSTPPLSQRTRSKLKSTVLTIPSSISAPTPYTKPKPRPTSIYTPGKTPISLHTRSRILLSQAMALSWSQQGFLTPNKHVSSPAHSPSTPRINVTTPPQILFSQYSPPTVKTGAIPKRTARHNTKKSRNKSTPYKSS